MTEPDVAELRRLLEAATSGPWVADGRSSALLEAAVTALPGLLDRLERQDAAVAAVRGVAMHYKGSYGVAWNAVATDLTAALALANTAHGEELTT